MTSKDIQPDLSEPSSKSGQDQKNSLFEAGLRASEVALTTDSFIETVCNTPETLLISAPVKQV